jgi:hypothetical protein
MATKAANDGDLHPKRSEGPKPWRRMAQAGDFVSRWKAALWAAPENRRPQPLPVRAACRPIAL